MVWSNAITQRFGTVYPIVQAPMLGVTTPEMVAAVSNSGGLGSLPVGGLSPEQTLLLIQKTKALTKAPFAVNFFAHTNAAANADEVEDMRAFVHQFCMENNVPFDKENTQLPPVYSYKEQIEVLLKEHIPIVSFTFGIPDDDVMKDFRQQDVLLIGTATCLKEAVILDQKGVDMICAQGIEAGGHRGTFVEDEPLPMIGLISLVPEIVSRVNKPILAAGGLSNGQAIKAAFSLGALGVQIGSAFIAAEESLAMPSYKEAVQQLVDTDTALTRAFSGRWARGIKNKFMEAMERAQVKIPAYPVQVGILAGMRRYAQQQNNKELTQIWAGQSALKTRSGSSADIFMQLVKDTEAIA